MSEISAKLVKELREMTGAGMMECKKALTEVEGDLEKAVDVLRVRGLAAAEKKAGRATNEGLVVAKVAADCLSAALVEVNCETDFVSRNETFAALANKIGDAVLASKPASLEALTELALDKGTVADAITDGIHTIGENMQVSRYACLSADKGGFSSYIHGGGRLGIIVQFSFDKPATATAEAFTVVAKDVAMQVAAANPLAVSQESFAPEVVEKEMSIYKAQAAESGKPESIQEQIATGRMKKFYAENALVEQAFIKDPDQTVREVLAAASKELGDNITVVEFVRFELGN
ncbi:MAG: translation elongation factor Ts [Coriobacteriia bacterium]|nr:translation elongation factor Ts [Coriobacteriia bacterium]MCL2749558.1 translation elongation factor Ts [Coriobacteriia bacterium]